MCQAPGDDARAGGGPEPDGSDARPLEPPRPEGLAGLLGIVAVAFVVRALPLFRGAGLDGHLGYDDGVYFGAAVALTNGVLPYRDFLLLHPPGIAVLLSPFALIAGATSDATGFAVARLAFMALGAVNAGLVTVVAGRYGRRAGLLGGRAVRGLVRRGARRAGRPILIGPRDARCCSMAMLVIGSPPGRSPYVAAHAVAGRRCLGAAAAIQVWAVLPVAVIGAMIALDCAGASRAGPMATDVGLLGRGGGGVRGRYASAVLRGGSGRSSSATCFIDQLARPSLGVTLADAPARARGALEPGRRRHRACWRSWWSSLSRSSACGAIVIVAAGSRPRGCGVRWSSIEAAYLLVAPNFFSHYSAWMAPAGGHRARNGRVAGRSTSVERSSATRRRWRGSPGSVAVVAAMALGMPRQQGSRPRRSHEPSRSTSRRRPLRLGRRPGAAAR